jgi:heavy metal translocating P-type ATPase
VNSPAQMPSIVIAHELQGRIRLRYPLLAQPDFDRLIFQAGLENIPGVQNVRVNSKAACAVVYYDASPLTRSRIVAYAGNGDHCQGLLGRRQSAQGLHSVLTLGLRGALALAVLFVPRPLAATLSLALSLPVLGDGVATLMQRGLKVEVLDAAAVGFSLLRRDYFTAASIVFLLSVGDYLEGISEDRSTGLLKSLLKPQVDSVWTEVNGSEMETPLAQVRLGDRVIFGPGDMIALDGTVLTGEASVNASSITGESVPVHASPGTKVLSGSVVEDGRIVIRAEHVGSETSMARITAFLENSLRSESDSQQRDSRLADRLVPVTFALGMGILLLTRDLSKAAGVLSVDYSCVIGLANPVTVRMAMYTAARNGVLLKGAQAIDLLARADTCIFDKTGTLTKGVLQVTDVLPLAGYSENEVLALAAGAEEHYSHPVALAVVRAAQERQVVLPQVSQVDFIVAHGVSAYIKGKNILVGSRHFIEEDEGIPCDTCGDDRLAALQGAGRILLYVACEKELIGLIVLRDIIRPEAAAVLQGLKRSGIRHIAILTGDGEGTARAIAAQIPAVDAVHWELKPEDKAVIVRRLQDEGRIVLFTGDGVNDAPALVSADIGACLPGGADIAKDSAQVILLRDNLQGLLLARLAAQRACATLKHSFNSAVGLNSILLALAAKGMLPPVAAALLHNISTIGILTYAGLRGRSLPRLVEENEPEKMAVSKTEHDHVDKSV